MTTTKWQRMAKAQRLSEKTLHVIFTTGEEIVTPHVYTVYENYELGTLEIYQNSDKMINAMVTYNLDNVDSWTYI